MPRYVDLDNPKIIRGERDRFGLVVYHIPPDTPCFNLAERKKGKWIVCGDKHVCSECDEFALCDAYDVLETGEYQEKLSDFCPNCGADMR